MRPEGRFAASRLDPVKASASAWVSQAAKDAKARGEGTIDLGLGEPDFDTPPHIIEATHRLVYWPEYWPEYWPVYWPAHRTAHWAALRGETRYPPTQGTIEMRQAVVDKLRRENDLTCAIDEVIVSKGAKQVLFHAMMATLEPSDEVLLCAPCFGRYKDILLILGGRPVAVTCPAEHGSRLVPEQLEKAITPGTRWILLNLPSNPAGAVYSDADLCVRDGAGETLKRKI